MDPRAPNISSRRRKTGLLWFIASLAISTPATGDELNVLVGDREPVALHVISNNQALRDQSDQIRAQVNDIFSSLTRLSLKSPMEQKIDTGRLDACEDVVKLSCWSRAVANNRTPYLIVLTANRLPNGKDYVDLTLLDMPRALAAVDHVDRSNEGWQQQLEDLIFQDAVHNASATIRIDELEELVRGFISKLEPLLVAAHHWRPNGAISIETARAGLTISLGGAIVGKTSSSPTVLGEVTEGKHELALTDEHGLIRCDPIQVDVARGKRAVVSPLFSAGPNNAPLVRRITFWSGIGTAVVGAVFVAVSATGRQEIVVTCPGGDCPSINRTFVTFSDLGSNPTAEGSGVLVAPLGYSLMLAGAGWSVGSLTLGEEWEIPWLAIGLGVALGATSYGVSTLIN